jgi:transcriptional regulator of nitric oxide reductase
VGSGSLAVGQAGIEASVLDKLKRLFPAATTFTPKEGEPLHFTAYTVDGRGGRSVLGYAFWTTEVVPLERGYGGRSSCSVGSTPRACWPASIVGEHHEPYGSFSIDMPAFPAQFKGKDVRDPFKLGEDIDAVSRATITMSSAVRTIRNASRRVARSLLTPPAATKP